MIYRDIHTCNIGHNSHHKSTAFRHTIIVYCRQAGRLYAYHCCYGSQGLSLALQPSPQDACEGGYLCIRSHDSAFLCIPCRSFWLACGYRCVHWRALLSDIPFAKIESVQSKMSGLAPSSLHSSGCRWIWVRCKRLVFSQSW